MADNLSVESPEFDRIRKETGNATEDAIKLLWYALNSEIDLRRQTVRIAKDTDSGKVLAYAPGASMDNFDTQGATTVYFIGGSAQNLTGVRNGVEGRRVMFHNLQAGTITVKNSATSDAANQFVTSSGGDKSMTTGTSFFSTYINGKWREFKGL
jgi:hypothetical protein